MNKLLISVLIILITGNLFAQYEAEYPLPNSPAFFQNPYFGLSLTKNIDTLELPFFDDFSNSNIYPSADLWTDMDVYINSHLADAPPSIGVASFDAMDGYGNFHSGVTPSNVAIADKLTSKPINLSGLSSSEVFLSFFYQPQGIADFPETGDSLMLEFYAPEEAIWTKVWAVAGANNHAFRQVIYPVNQPQYLKKGFQFRFVNKVSLSSSTIPSIVSNCDFWHVDYIYLNKQRTINDTVYHDIAIQAPFVFKVGEYESIPYSHYKKAYNQNKLKSTFVIKFKNNDKFERTIDSLNLNIINGITNQKEDFIYIGSYNLPENLQQTIENKTYNYLFAPNSSDTAEYLMQSYLVTNSFDLNTNNSSTIKKEFKNYYAYDDGSAEFGYGLRGEGTQNASVAYRFFTYKTDTIYGADMCFVKAFNNASQKYFYLSIWNHDETTGLPGELIYRKSSILPDYGSGLNKYKRYVLDSNIVVSDTFYVGWTQTTTDQLNIGLDKNNTQHNHKYYKISNQWQKSSIDGELLIRPILSYLNSQSIGIDNRQTPEVKIFPNPTKSILNIELSGQNLDTPIDIKIFDMTGKLYFQKKIDELVYSVDFSSFNSGLYFIHLSSSFFRITQKIVKIE